MTDIVLLEKTYSSYSNRATEALLKDLCKGLKVKLKIRGKTARDWIEVEASGEDEPIAMKIIDREIGIAPVASDKVERFALLRGKISGISEAHDGLVVDVGAFLPQICCAILPLWRLRAQLTDGKKLPLHRIIELYCLYDSASLNVRILSEIDSRTCLWESELAEAQLSFFSGWCKSSLDRLIVLGAARWEVENAVDATGHRRDVVRVESLGLFEHAVECKLGTDAVGLIPSIGRVLRQASLMPFSPRGIREELTR